MLEHFGASANEDCSSILVQICLPLFTRLIVLLTDAVLVLSCLSSFT